MQYVFAAWSITKDLPEWESQGRDNTTTKCFRELAKFCKQALRNGNFLSSTLDVYVKKLVFLKFRGKKSRYFQWIISHFTRPKNDLFLGIFHTTPIIDIHIIFIWLFFCLTKALLTRCGHWGSKGPHASFATTFFEKKQFCHFIFHARTYLIHFTCFVEIFHFNLQNKYTIFKARLCN